MEVGGCDVYTLINERVKEVAASGTNGYCSRQLCANRLTVSIKINE